jgi:hypothetical protein
VALARLELESGNLVAAQAFCEQAREPSFRIVDPADRSWPILNALLADMICQLQDCTAAHTLRQVLSPYAGLFAIGGSASSVLLPMTTWLGRLSATAGDMESATRYFERAVEECRMCESVTQVAWAEYDLARAYRTLARPRDRARAAQLFESARLGAEHARLYRLQDAIDELHGTLA